MIKYTKESILTMRRVVAYYDCETVLRLAFTRSKRSSLEAAPFGNRPR